MFKIAITGGIGSGKSVAVKILKESGYKCFSADKIYNDLLKNEEFVISLSEYMGVPPIMTNGKTEFNKNAVSDLVFTDKNALKRLNEYTHPVVMKILADKISRAESEKIVFAEVPILFEEGYDKLFDYVFVIKRKFDVRLINTMSRDGKSEEEVRKVVKSQFDYEKILQSDNVFIVDNNGSLDDLKEKLFTIINDIDKK